MTTSPWISVKDRLPSINQLVLSYHSKFGMLIDRYVGQPLKEITYWMPLPDPPKPEDPFETWWNRLERPNQSGMDKRRVVAHLDTFVYEAEARTIWDAAIASQKTDKQQP